MGTFDTLKDFYGDVADDWKKAYDELLDRDEDDDLPLGLSSHALAAMPGDAMRNALVMSLLKGDDSKKKNKNRDLAALLLLSGGGPSGGFAAAAPAVAGLGGAAAGALSAIGTQRTSSFPDAGAPLGALGSAGDALQGLSALPQQVQQLSELIEGLLSALRAMEPLLGAAKGLGVKK
ncbi:hypothetical protein ACIRJR_10155 [Streptomyces sp. NPDC102402]|uniref:hypothetical protein n=1 Tax=Streptomyces sp. NPDC102402 TaxID=3366169 RepID=UPI003821CBBF